MLSLLLAPRVRVRVINDSVQMFYLLLEGGRILIVRYAFTSRIDLFLILLSYISLQMGFFKRSDPYGTTMEKAQLKPQASSEA